MHNSEFTGIASIAPSIFPDTGLSRDSQILQRRIETMRDQLLDLSGRNPLISYVHHERSTRYVRIVDELPSEIENRLSKGLGFSFAAVPHPHWKEPDDEKTPEFKETLAQIKNDDESYKIELEELGPDPGERPLLILERKIKNKVRERLGLPQLKVDRATPAAEYARTLGIETSYELGLRIQGGDLKKKHNDDKLQTLLYPEQLESRLSQIYKEAKLIATERGINTLYCVLGFLEWYESRHSERSYLSPLLLYPVELRRKLVRHQYVYELCPRDEDIVVNSSLGERLRRDFGMALPEWNEEMNVDDYFKAVMQMVGDEPNWKIRSYVTLGFFSYSKIAMYHDLNLENWQQIFADPNAPGYLLLNGHADNFTLTVAPDYDYEAQGEAPPQPFLVTNADVSQTSAISDVLAGRNLVIQGPPGTGKSQTITNIVAAALESGKRVLFVCEKSAALAVVKNRLDHLGLGDFCLEIHSNKVNKTEVLTALRESLDLRQIPGANSQKSLENLKKRLALVKSEISQYLNDLHTQIGPRQEKPFDIVWRHINLQVHHADILNWAELVRCRRFLEWDSEDIAEISYALHQYRELWGQYGTSLAAWNRLLPQLKSPLDPRALQRRLADLQDAGHELETDWQKLKHDSQVCMETPSLSDLKSLGTLAAACRNLPADKLVSLVEILPYSDTAPFQETQESLYEFRTALKTLEEIWERKIQKAPAPASIEIQSALLDIPQSCLMMTVRDVRLGHAESRELLENHESASELLTSCWQVLKLPAKDHPADLRILLALVRKLKQAPRIIFQQRLSTLADPLLCLQARTYFQALQQWKQNFAELAERYVIDKKMATSIWEQDLAILQKAGPLSFFNSGVRQAKRRLNSSVRQSQTKLKKSTSITICQELTRFFSERDRLAAYPDLSMIFGRSIDPIEDELSALGETLNFEKILDEAIADDYAAGLPIKSALLSLSTANMGMLLQWTESKTWAFLEERLEKMLTPFADEARRIMNAISWQQKTLRIADELKLPETFRLVKFSDLMNAWRACEHEYSRLERNPCWKILGSECSWDDIRAFNEQPWHCFLNAWNQFQWKKEERSHWTQAHGIRFLCEWDPDHWQKLELDIRRTEDGILQLGTLALPTDASTSTWLQLEETPLDVWVNNAKECLDHLPQLAIHQKCQALTKQLQDMGADSILPLIQTHNPGQDELRCLWDSILSWHAVRLMEQNVPGVNQLLGDRMNELRSRFAEIDQQLMEANRNYLREKLLKKPLDAGENSQQVREKTGLALIKHELSKRSKHIALRELFRRAGSAMAALKPCFMMSPVNVAQYLHPNAGEFDLLVIDEASQLRPQDAFGSIMRAKQIVVVGDSKQLPPTSFFDRALQETDTSDDEEDVDGIESILDMAQKIWMPARRLRWHYRSRHESLIHFSNQEFYDNDLVIFPRAETSVESSGIRLFQVNGTYVGQKNPAEVDAILEAVLLHARQRPELSLGIVTMNKPQTDLLSEALDDYARKNPEVEAFRNRWDCSLEPLIIKNLENIQGDERDVIMISTLYGQDAEGRFFQRFGPINSAFGHRRLNVLFTRAKQQMQIFTSLDPDKILTEGDRKSLGVRALKSFLRYSRDGIIRTTESSGPSLKQPDSVFEEFVIRRLIKHGYQVVPQYGVAGFFIDIAVRNPRCSDTFLLGIECDGAAFHSSKSARDRDRNRQEILESMGWEIYRIWSSDWFLNEDGEMSKLLQHLQALSTKVQMRHEPTTPRV